MVTVLGRLKAKAKRIFTKTNWNLIVELTRANFKLTDHNSILGVLWSLLVPLSLFLVMYFAFREKFEHEINEYPLYLLIGICCVNFFITSSTYMTKVFCINRGFIANSAIPRENFIISDSFIHIYKFIIELLLCYLLCVVYGVFTWTSFLFLFPLLLSYLAFAIGVGLMLSLIYCFTSDIFHGWTISSRILLFATPIFYNLENLSPIFRNIIYFFNPLTPFLISFRDILMNINGMNMANYSYSLWLGLIFFILGYYAFIALETIAMERV